MNTPGRRLLWVVALAPDAAARERQFREVKTVQRKRCLSVSSLCLLIRSSMDVRSGSQLRTLVNLPVSTWHAHIRGLLGPVEPGTGAPLRAGYLSKRSALPTESCGLKNQQ